MKNGWREAVGRTIEGVIVGSSKGRPHHQVFLLFSDGTSLEIYGDSFTCAGGVDRSTDPERAIHPREGRVEAVYWAGSGPRPAGPLQTGGDLPAYDLNGPQSAVSIADSLRAWNAAKAAIRKASHR